MCDTGRLWTHYPVITVTPTANDYDTLKCFLCFRNEDYSLFENFCFRCNCSLMRPGSDEDFPDGKSNLMNGRKSGAAKRSVSSRGKGFRREEHHWMQFNWKSGQAAIFEIEDAACYDAQPSFDREIFNEKRIFSSIFFPSSSVIGR